MGTASHPETEPRIPLLVRGTRVLEYAALIVIGLAIAVEFAVAVRDANPAGFIAGAVMVIGMLVAYRLRPVVGLVLIAAGPLVATGLGWLPTHNWSIACFAAFVLTLRGLPGVLTGVLVAVANLLAVGFYHGTISPETNAEASIAAAAALALAASGSAIHGQRQYFGELQKRTHEAIATRQALAERSVAQERLRIARDLHDSVGHEIAVVSMHLGAAEVHLPTDPDAAAADLVAARTSVQSVLRETQEILQVLRDEAGSLTPTPDHSRVPALVDSLQEAGVEIDARFAGLDQPLPTGTSTAVFRIVQEALTNAQRYGEPPVSLRVLIDHDTVSVEAVNVHRDPTGRDHGGGRGLVGMRERAESAGGTLKVRDDGRVFSVRAEMPSHERRAS